MGIHIYNQNNCYIVLLADTTVQVINTNSNNRII